MLHQFDQCEGSPATLVPVIITLATVAIALFITCHPCCCCHHPLCHHCPCLPTTLVKVTIALFVALTVHLPTILVAIAITLLPLLSLLPSTLIAIAITLAALAFALFILLASLLLPTPTPLPLPSPSPLPLPSLSPALLPSPLPLLLLPLLSCHPRHHCPYCCCLPATLNTVTVGDKISQSNKTCSWDSSHAYYSETNSSWEFSILGRPCQDPHSNQIIA